jgi:hypothetical protein
MASQPIHYENCEDALSCIQGELLEALLQPQEDCYPWNPAEPEAEAYFAELERGFFLSDWQEEEEMKSASQAFFNKLHQCWVSPMLPATETLITSLSKRFATLPQEWLEAIVNRARQAFSTNLSLADQLVMCVEPLLPNWAEDDLLVLARPWAYAMRGNSEQAVAETTGVPQPRDWAALSQVEQVRLSLAVAHSALAQLKDDTNGLESS